MDGSSLIVLGVLFAASVIDLRTRRVPNLITFPFFFAGLIYHVHSGDLLSSFGGAAIGLLWLLIPYILHWVGAGDVKLIAATGAWVGWPGAITFVLFCGASGALWVCLFYLGKAEVRSLWLSSAGGAGKVCRQMVRTARENGGTKVPYAGTVLLGFIAFKLLGGAF